MNIFHFSAIALGLVILVLDFISFMGTRLFIPLLVVAITVSWLPFWIDFFIRLRKDREIERLFPYFVGDLVNTVKSGIPISQKM